MRTPYRGTKCRDVLEAGPAWTSRHDLAFAEPMSVFSCNRRVNQLGEAVSPLTPCR
jgi:hypothetical protein